METSHAEHVNPGISGEEVSNGQEASEVIEHGMEAGRERSPSLGRFPTYPPSTAAPEEEEVDREGEEHGDQERISPFIEGTNIQYAWDATSIELFKRCPRLYQYRIIDGWISNEESVHLRFGIEFHKALHNYDKARAAGIEHDDAVYDTVRDTIIDTADWKPDHKYKNIPNLLRSVVWYLDHYNPDPAESIILEGGEPACEVNFKFALDFGPQTSDMMYMLCGYLDKVVKFQGERFIKDTKTTRITPGAYYFQQYEPNNQMTLYTLAGNVVFGTLIKGVIIDAVQIGVDFSRFVRGLTYRTQDQLNEWLSDLRIWLRKAEEYAVEGYWPQNDTACDKYGGCPFREVCSKSPHVREVYLKSSFTKAKESERWNPLIPRE